jgi:Spy/CpxP family protein refolding chaperone
MKRTFAVLTLALCATAAMAQGAPQAPIEEDDAILIAQSGPGGPDTLSRDVQIERRTERGPGGGMQTRIIERHGPMKFWNDSEIATKIKLTDDQKQKLESTFTSYRLKLIDQRAAVEREEVKLEPLVQSDKLDEAAITKQIDSLISARG